VPVRGRLSLEMSAHTRYRMHALPESERRAGLQRPDLISTRVQGLAAGWRRSSIP